MKTIIHYAWRLPLFVLIYIVISYLASSFSASMPLKYSLEWLVMARVEYAFMWFWNPRWFSIPFWLVCHCVLFVASIRYARSGLAKDGWRLVLIGLLCSAGGAYLLHLMPFIMGMR